MLTTLRDLRSLQVVVYHPKDRECDDLVAHILRIGCRVEAVWPPQGALRPDVDLAFVLFRQDATTIGIARSLQQAAPRCTLVAIVESESPAMIELVVETGAAAVITKPIRAFGLLTSIIVAHTLNRRMRVSTERVVKLEARIRSLKQIEKAKSILMNRRGLSEQDAYDMIRMRAMSRRMTMETVCSSIIEADDIF
ncbi:MAG: ANTAR domain-containing protein [Alsobacter sp.]